MTEETNTQKDEIYGKPAGFWGRALAWMYDCIILITVIVALSVLADKVFGVILFPWWWVLSLCYFVLFQGKYGQTPGKMLLGIKVVKTDDSPAGFISFFIRTLLYLPVSATCFAGFVTMAYNKDKRAIHDLIVGTKVIKIRRVSFWVSVPIILVILWLIFMQMLNFRRLIVKANQTYAKEQLSVIRKAINIYYGDNSGWPNKLDSLIPEYLDEIYEIKLSRGRSNTWKLDPTPDTDITAEDIDNSTAWMYNNKTGALAVNSDKPDSKGIPYYEW